MKSYKTFRAAVRAAQGEPIIKVGDLYVVGAKLSGLGLEEIQLIDGGTHQIVGNIILRHLDRLGNANWADPSPESPDKNHRPVLWPKE